MKYFVCIFLILIFLSSCNYKKGNDPFSAITEMVDSAERIHKSKLDTDSIKKPILIQPIPIKADELFEDFIYSYTSKEKFQLERTEFPLIFINDNDTSKIEQKFWKHDYIFSKQEFYTLLFDSEDDMELEGDTDLNEVQVDWVYLGTRKVKHYLFDRDNGAWLLKHISLQNLDEQQGSIDFFDFYFKFMNDSIYQRKHIKDPLDFVTVDPDDDFSILETTMDVDQWYAFKPELPADHLTNINYGQSNDQHSNTKILKLNGIGNGYSILLYFKKKNDEWGLYKYEDSSI